MSSKIGVLFMKIKEKEEARRLRKEDGMSINDISTKLRVAKSSVSLWVRDVKLSEDQINRLLSKNPIFNNQMEGAKARKDNALLNRKKFQDYGASMAEEIKCSRDLFLAGCMLFWAEGSKNKNIIEFVNSDPIMINIFMKFLRVCLSIKDEDIKISINCYVNNNLMYDEIEKFWLKETNLSKDNFNKATINNTPKSSSGNKKNKLIYGVCKIRVSNTEKVQNIFGAINKYTSSNDYKWIN